MLEVLTLEEYKNTLIEYYRYGYDKDKQQERKTNLEKSYSDEFLNKIINDTKNFILKLIYKYNTNRKIYESVIFSTFPINNIKYISIGLIGGDLSDTLYVIEPNLIVSRLLLKQIFKGYINIEEKEKVVDNYDEEFEIGSEYFVSYLFISMKVDKYDEIKNNKVLQKIMK